VISNDQPQQDAILDVRDLSVSYRTTKAVDGVSLHVKRGEIFGLLGPNGAGKTSTLSAIEGLLRPDSGTVLVEGIDVQRHPARARSKMGVQLQATSFQAQLSIKQIVRLYAGLYGIELSDRQITEGLDAIGLGHETLKLFKPGTTAQIGLRWPDHPRKRCRDQGELDSPKNQFARSERHLFDAIFSQPVASVGDVR